MLVLAAATAIGALGLAAGGSAGALLAEDITGSSAWAGVPLGVLVVGSAFSALVIGRRTRRSTRTAGLRLGFAVGSAGAVLVVAAAAFADLALLLVGSAALGAANAAIFLSRYAAVDLGGEAARGSALGTVFLATAVGAVASPNLLGPSGELAGAVGLPRLSGLYLVAAASFAAAGLLVGTRPNRSQPRAPAADSAHSLRSGIARARVALVVLALVNFVMVAVMAIAPVHMSMHGHGLDFVGVVISVHVLCMFAPAPLTGRLADRAGSATVVTLGALLLAAAGVTGACVDMSNGTAMTAMLALLGLGWNAGVVGASTMLATSVAPHLRPHTEAIGEVAMGLAAGAGAPAAGFIVAVGDFAALCVAGAIGGALVLAALRLGRRHEGPSAVARVPGR